MEKQIKDTNNVSDQILAKLQKDIAEIKTALLGNEYNPHGGLLYRTTELECKLEKLQAKYDKAMWTSGGAAIVIAVVANLVMWLFDVWKMMPAQ
jgi:hypothetical protein